MGTIEFTLLVVALSIYPVCKVSNKISHAVMWLW
jgi:hypothetical protein